MTQSDQPHDMPEKRAIGRRVQYLRERLGMSQHGLAAAAGLSTSYISLIEAGQRIPRDAALRSLARALRVPPSQLLGKRPADVAVIELELQQAEAALEAEQPLKLLQRLRILSRRYVGALTWDLDCRLHVLLGEAERRAGDPERAIRDLEKLRADGEVPDNLMVRLIRTLCAAYLEVGDLARCIELAEQELQRLRRLDLAFSEEYVSLGGLLTAAYLERGEVVRAEVLAEEVISQSERGGSSRARGAAYHSASLAAEARGDRESARHLAASALAIFAELGDRRQLAVMQLEYAQILLSVDPPDPVRARELLVSAEGTIKAIGIAADVARLKLAGAQAQLALGDADAALAQAEVSWQHNRSRGLLAAQALMVIAQCHLARDDKTAALAALSSAAADLARAAPNRGNGRLWRDLGDLYTRFGMTEEAAAAYRSALVLAGLPPRRVLTGN
jgi:transcriptional regulator with XRE-family HTH domain